MCFYKVKLILSSVLKNNLQQIFAESAATYFRTLTKGAANLRNFYPLLK